MVYQLRFNSGYSKLAVVLMALAIGFSSIGAFMVIGASAQTASDPVDGVVWTNGGNIEYMDADTGENIWENTQYDYYEAQYDDVTQTVFGLTKVTENGSLTIAQINASNGEIIQNKTSNITDVDNISVDNATDYSLNNADVYNGQVVYTVQSQDDTRTLKTGMDEENTTVLHSANRQSTSTLTSAYLYQSIYSDWDSGNFTALSGTGADAQVSPEYSADGKTGNKIELKHSLNSGGVSYAYFYLSNSQTYDTEIWTATNRQTIDLSDMAGEWYPYLNTTTTDGTDLTNGKSAFAVEEVGHLQYLVADNQGWHIIESSGEGSNPQYAQENANWSYAYDASGNTTPYLQSADADWKSAETGDTGIISIASSKYTGNWDNDKATLLTIEYREYEYNTATQDYTVQGVEDYSVYIGNYTTYNDYIQNADKWENVEMVKNATPDIQTAAGGVTDDTPWYESQYLYLAVPVWIIVILMALVMLVR